MTTGLLAPRHLVPAPPRRAARPAAPPRRRTARATLAWGLVGFVAANLGLAVALETTHPQWRDPEFGHRLTRLRQSERAHPDRPLVLVLGTSRAQNAICPAAMGFADAPGSPRVFNFGQSASPPLKVLLTYRRLREAGVRPAAVLVEILPTWTMANGPAEKELETQWPRLAAADLRHLRAHSRTPTALWRGWLYARLVPWHTQRVALLSHWLPRWLPWETRLDGNWTSMDADGFQPIGFVRPEAREAATAHAWKQYQLGFQKYWPGPASFRALDELVSDCRAEGIPVAVFLPPVSPAFRAAFRPGVYEAGEQAVRQFAHSRDVPVFPPPEGLEETDFMDGHHMMRSGAETYSRWLADTHLKPWLQAGGIGR